MNNYISISKSSPTAVYYLKDTQETITFTKYLGGGGTKSAFLMSNNKVVLIPNFLGTTSHLLTTWPKVVESEVKLAQFLHKLGILHSRASKGILATTSEEEGIPVIISDTFDILKWKIIDCKRGESSTWKENEDYILANEEDRFNEEKWDDAVDPLIHDIALLFTHKFPRSLDSLNLAVQKIDGRYKLRYFGFDYTNRNGCYTPPLDNPTEEDADDKSYEFYLETLLGTFFSYEITYPKNLHPEAKAFKQKLLSRYASRTTTMISIIYAQNRLKTLVSYETTAAINLI